MNPSETFQWFLTNCGFVCDIFLGKYPIVFSLIGFILVILIYLKLKRIDQYVEVMHQEALELKKLARFPYCNDCGYRDTCMRRITEVNECTYDYRKSMASD